MARRFNRKPLNNEQRDARRRAGRDRMEQAARALLTTDGWQRWIKVRASNGLARYSVGNQMILAVEAYRRGISLSYVAGFRAWLQLNRVPRKGEGIRILAPVTVKDQDEQGEATGGKRVFFKTVTVWDVSGTDSQPDSQGFLSVQTALDRHMLPRARTIRTARTTRTFPNPFSRTHPSGHGPGWAICPTPRASARSPRRSDACDQSEHFHGKAYSRHGARRAMTGSRLETLAFGRRNVVIAGRRCPSVDLVGHRKCVGSVSARRTLRRACARPRR